jgi:hypothetical protein
MKYGIKSTSMSEVEGITECFQNKKQGQSIAVFLTITRFFLCMKLFLLKAAAFGMCPWLEA